MLKSDAAKHLVQVIKRISQFSIIYAPSRALCMITKFTVPRNSLSSSILQCMHVYITGYIRTYIYVYQFVLVCVGAYVQICICGVCICASMQKYICAKTAHVCVQNVYVYVTNPISSDNSSYSVDI